MFSGLGSTQPPQGSQLQGFIQIKTDLGVNVVIAVFKETLELHPHHFSFKEIHFEVTPLEGGELAPSTEVKAQEEAGIKEGELPDSTKTLQEVAKQIVKLIPEKLNFVLQLAVLKLPFQKIEKETKSLAEENQQKAPTTKAQAVTKGESKTTQEPEVIEEIEPVEKLLEGLFLPAAKEKIILKKEGFIPTGSPQPKEKEEPTANFLGIQWKSASKEEKQGAFPEVKSQGPAVKEANVSAVHHKATFSYPIAFVDAEGMVKAKEQTAVSTPERQEIVPQTSPQIKPIHPGERHAEKIALEKPTKREGIQPVDKSERHPSTIQKLTDEGQIVRFPPLPESRSSTDDKGKNSAASKTFLLKPGEGFNFRDILLMMLCGVICKAKTVAEMASYFRRREGFFTAWLGLKAGLPTSRLLTILLTCLNPEEFKELLLFACGKRELHFLSEVGVWETDRGVILADLNADNELKREVFSLFDLSKVSVTVISNRFKELPESIKRLGGEYSLLLKEGHMDLYKHALEFFVKEFPTKREEIPHEIHHDVWSFSGISILREVLALSSHYVLEQGVGSLKSLVQLISESTANQRSEFSRHIYFSTYPPKASLLASTLRHYAALEAKAEWIVDFDFNQGKSNHTQENFHLLWAMAQKLLSLESSYKATLEVKQKKAFQDNVYLRSVLGLKTA